MANDTAMQGAGMTAAERQRFEDMENKIDDMHRALFSPAVGEKHSMVEKLAMLVDVSEKGQWAANRIIKGVLTIGALVAAIAAIRTGLMK